jgi:DNA-3-methyladenine glycosylase I
MSLKQSSQLKLQGLGSYCVHVCKKTFVFTGGEIVKEFLISTGYLPGAHEENCPVYAKIQQQNPP